MVSQIYPTELQLNKANSYDTVALYKGALTWYGKLTWESAHAWNLIILCLSIV